MYAPNMLLDLKWAYNGLPFRNILKIIEVKNICELLLHKNVIKCGGEPIGECLSIYSTKAKKI